jgi:hypothetical protein
MDLAAAEALAMVLPLPVATRCDDPLQFVDLSDAPDLFDRLDAAFPVWDTMAPRAPRSPQAATLPVVRVGAFDASFVPRAADFARLDPRFRLLPEVARAVDTTGERGFAVFQLRATSGGLRGWLDRLRASPVAVHPMGLVFRPADPTRLFFPTVHAHDGAAPPVASFDHTLYAQVPGRPGSASAHHRLGWEESERPLGEAARGSLVDPTSVAFRARITGDRTNADVEVPIRPVPHADDVARVAARCFGADAPSALGMLAAVTQRPGVDPSEDRLAAIRLAGHGPRALDTLRAVTQRWSMDQRAAAIQPSWLAYARRGGPPLSEDAAAALDREDEAGWDAWVGRA